MDGDKSRIMRKLYLLHYQMVGVILSKSCFGIEMAERRKEILLVQQGYGFWKL